MKHILLFPILFFAFMFSLKAQAKFRKLKELPPSQLPYSKKVLAIEKKNHTCVRINPQSFSVRLKRFPFNKAAQVQLVSFEGFKLPVINDTVCFSKLKETKTLTLQQIDSLTDIMYNVGYGGTILLESEMSCYDPRNAILFKDIAGNTFAYIEICFKCQQVVTKPEEIETGDFCNEKFDLLQKQFLHAGISYGTKEEDKP